jgi:microcystin-dependent protein
MSLKYTTVPTKTLAASITAAATSFTVNNIEGWDGEDLVAGDFGTEAYGVFRNSNGTALELFKWDPSTIASASITILARGLDFTGDLTTEDAARKLVWVKGDTRVDLGTDTPQLFQFLKEYVDGISVAGAADASTIAKGIAEEATTAEINAATGSGGTGARLFMNPSAFSTTTYASVISSLTGAIVAFGSSTPPTGWLNCDGSAVSRTTYASLFAVVGTTYGAGNGTTTFNLPNLLGRFPLGYSASAPTKTLTFSSRSSDTITVTGADNHANNEIQTGQAVLYDTTSGAISGLVDNTTYYLIRVAYNQFKLATSVANANAGTAITLSSDGSGTQTFVITYTARPMAQTGGEETHALTDSELPSHRHQLMDGSTGNSGSGNEIVDALENNSVSGTLRDSVSITGNDTPHNIMPLFAVVNYIIKT